jgi:hypothetical protein
LRLGKSRVFPTSQKSAFSGINQKYKVSGGG